MDERLQSQLAFIAEIDKMKTIHRLTLLMDKSRCETDAEHSWHVAAAALILKEYAAEEINADRVIQMALVHDLVEIYAGDTPAYDTQGYLSKTERERDAADKIFAILPSIQGQDIRALWEEFEKMETPDAKFAAALDRLMPLISNHFTEGHTWAENNVREEQIYSRMDVIRTAAPKLWPYVQGVIDEGIEKGYVVRRAHPVPQKRT
jgi:putative hydrolase of HD superfamily